MIIEKLSALRPGKILGEDVFNFQGLLLLKKKTPLTDKNLRMLKSWGITEVTVSGEHDPIIKENHFVAGSDEDQNIETEIKEKYIGGADNPVMREIMSTALDLLAKRK